MACHEEDSVVRSCWSHCPTTESHDLLAMANDLAGSHQSCCPKKFISQGKGGAKRRNEVKRGPYLTDTWGHSFQSA